VVKTVSLSPVSTSLHACGSQSTMDTSAARTRSVAGGWLVLVSRVARSETGCANGDRQRDRRTDGQRRLKKPSCRYVGLNKWHCLELQLACKTAKGLISKNGAISVCRGTVQSSPSWHWQATGRPVGSVLNLSVHCTLSMRALKLKTRDKAKLHVCSLTVMHHRLQ